ncbi:MAG: OpgC domain-containing protein [Planctomycetota bacterium]
MGDAAGEHGAFESRRITSVDLTKGFALVCVLIDHVEGINRVAFLSRLTIQGWMFCDASEVFVFLSGVTNAISNSRRLQEHTITQCFLHTLRKSLQVYLWYLLCLSFSLLIAWSFQAWNPQLESRFRLHLPWHDHLLAGILFANHPYGCAIFPLFAMLLPFGMVVSLSLQRFGASRTFVSSLLLYVLSQFITDLSLHSMIPGRARYFNPFSWQFLFVLGMVAWHGRKRLRQRLELNQGHGKVILFVSVITFTFNAIVNQTDWLPVLGHEIPNSLQSKTTLGVLRIGSVLTLMYFARWFACSCQKRFGPSWYGFFVAIGRSPIQFYCWSVIWAVVSMTITGNIELTSFDIVVLDVSSVSAAFMFAFFLQLHFKRLLVA